MKRFILSILLLFVTAGLCAQPNIKNSKADFPKKVSIEIGLAYMLMSPADMENMHFVGIVLGGGFYVSPRSRLNFDIAIQGMVNDGERVGSFSYTKQVGSGSTTYHTDGVITRTFTAVPILASWSYEIPLGEKAWMRVGPSAGFTVLSSVKSYTPQPTEGSAPKDAITKAALTGGANLGVAFKVMDNGALDIGYKLLANTGMTFESNTLNIISHQITVGMNVFF